AEVAVERGVLAEEANRGSGSTGRRGRVAVRDGGLGRVRVELDEAAPAHRDGELEGVRLDVVAAEGLAERLGVGDDRLALEPRELLAQGVDGLRVDDGELDGAVAGRRSVRGVQEAGAERGVVGELVVRG